MKNKRRGLIVSQGCKNFVLLAVLGFFAGFCNGLLGAGGGVVLVLLFKKLLPHDNEGARSAYSNALLVMFFLSCLTLWRYFAMGTRVSLVEHGGVWLAAGAIIGGLLAGFVLGRIKKGAVGKLFGVLTMISGVLMIFA